jgi:hypothetical protein
VLDVGSQARLPFHIVPNSSPGLSLGRYLFLPLALSDDLRDALVDGDDPGEEVDVGRPRAALPRAGAVGGLSRFGPEIGPAKGASSASPRSTGDVICKLKVGPCFSARSGGKLSRWLCFTIDTDPQYGRIIRCRKQSTLRSESAGRKWYLC